MLSNSGKSTCSDNTAEERPQKNDASDRPTHQSRLPVSSKYEAQRAKIDRSEDYRTERGRGGGAEGGHRRFEGRRIRREKKILPAPDYLVNPCRWTKYNLADDGTEGLRRSGMSDDQVNNFAAFQFLNELRERKKREREEGEEERGAEEGKVLFRNPKKSKGEDTVSEGRSDAERTKEVVGTGDFGSGGVLKMPEYVVGGGKHRGVGGVRGQRRQGQQQLQVIEEEGSGGVTASVGTKTKSCISLSHLEQEEEG